MQIVLLLGLMSATHQGIVAPDTPTRLTPGTSAPPGPTRATTDTITLTWRSVSGSDYYNIEGGAVGNDEARTSVSGTSFSVPSSIYATPGQYRWRIRACGESGCSSYSRYRYLTVVDEQVAPVTNFGLFVGSHDPGSWYPEEWSRLSFADNAREMSAAFGARTSSTAFTLTGDLRKDSQGNYIRPLMAADLKNEMWIIRNLMKPGDTFKLYINNHGGSAVISRDGTAKTNDQGIGDEFISIGDPNDDGLLYDNDLADMLRIFDGHRVDVFLDSCHGGGFWGKTDLLEGIPPQKGFNDIGALNNIALYAAAPETKEHWAPARSMTWWGAALLEAFQSAEEWKPEELANFLETRTKELAWFGQAEPVWYTMGHGDPVIPDPSQVDSFTAYSPDYNLDASIVESPDPAMQFIKLDELVFDIGPGDSLLSKVDFIKDHYESGDIIMACGYLKALINQVDAQTGKKISEAEGLKIRATAELTANTLGCK